METVLYVIFFLSCLVLVIAVLLQPGKTDAGALFTSGISSAALNPRGTQSVLSKLTIAAAAVFMISALLLSLPALTGSRSVLDTQSVEDTDTSGANTNSSANAENSNVSSTNSGNTSEVEPANATSGSKTNDGDAPAGSKQNDSDAKPSNP